MTVQKPLDAAGNEEDHSTAHEASRDAQFIDACQLTFHHIELWGREQGAHGVVAGLQIFDLIMQLPGRLALVARTRRRSGSRAPWIVIFGHFFQRVRRKVVDLDGEVGDGVSDLSLSTFILAVLEFFPPGTRVGRGGIGFRGVDGRLCVVGWELAVIGLLRDAFCVTIGASRVAVAISLPRGIRLRMGGVLALVLLSCISAGLLFRAILAYGGDLVAVRMRRPVAMGYLCIIICGHCCRDLVACKAPGSGIFLLHRTMHAKHR